MGTLFLRLGDHGASWIVRGPDALQPVGHGSLEEAALRASGHRLVVLVPAADVLLTEARLPPGQARRLRQAVPFAIEEQLSDDVEQLHFALAPKRAADGAQPVAVVSRERMRSWTSRLDAAGLHAGAMVPESLALPFEEGAWTLLLDESHAVLRTGLTRGHALELDAIGVMLALALEQAGEKRPARLRLFHCGGDDTVAVREACAAAQVDVIDESCRGGAMALFSAGLASSAPMDLLQGDFNRRESLGGLWRPWRTAAALLGVLLLLQLGLGVYHYVTLKRESVRLQAEIETVYRQAFPEAKNIVNPRLQMEQHLKQLRGGGSGAFAALMARSAPVLRAEAGLEPGAIRFKDDVLDVEITVSDFQAIDRLKQAFAGKGVNAEVQNASASGGKTRGVLRLREGR